MKRSKFYYLTHLSVGIPALLAKVSDSYALKQQWKSKRGTNLDLRHPQKLSEKLQWLKIHDRKPLYTTLVDKYRAKIWLENQFGAEHIIPTLFVYQNVDEIDFDALPHSFAIKCNHDSGSVFLCHDKSKGVFLDKHMHEYQFEEVKRILNQGLKHNYWRNAIEWPYKNVKPRILAEEYIEGQDLSMIYVEGIGAVGPCIVNCDSEFYDYEMKTIKDDTVDIQTTNGGFESLKNIVLTIAEKLDIKGYAKIDFRKKDDKYYLIEVNSQVSFHPTGEFITCAKTDGYSFDDIINYIVEKALETNGKKNSIGYKVIDNDR